MLETTDEEMAEWRNRLLSEVHAIDAEIARLRARSESIRTTLKGLDAILGTETDQPRGKEAVRRVVADAETPLTVREITEDMVRRGWASDATNAEPAVRAAIKRLRKAEPSRWQLTGGRLVYHPEREEVRTT